MHKHVSPEKLIIAGILLLSFSTLADAQTMESPKKWYTKFKEYIYGDAWHFDSLLYTTHRKVLLGIGERRISDSYLSPITHVGSEIKLKVLVDSPKRKKCWHWFQDMEISASSLRNPANRAAMYSFGGEYSLASLFPLYDNYNFRFEAGPAGNLNAQGNVKLSNTNNVANLKASLGIDAILRGVYRLQLGEYPMIIGYSNQFSLFHLAFSPEYGQSYYDYVSDYSDQSIRLYGALPNVRLNMKQRGVIDVPIHNTTLTLGIEHVYNKTKINNIKYSQSAVSVLVGFSFDVISLSGGKSMRSRSVVNAYHP